MHSNISIPLLPLVTGTISPHLVWLSFLSDILQQDPAVPCERTAPPICSPCGAANRTSCAIKTSRGLQTRKEPQEKDGDLSGDSAGLTDLILG